VNTIPVATIVTLQAFNVLAEPYSVILTFALLKFSMPMLGMLSIL